MTELLVGTLALALGLVILMVWVVFCMRFSLQLILAGSVGLLAGLAALIGGNILQPDAELSAWQAILIFGSLGIFVSGTMGDALEND
jgi:hypothetical protein